ncbi:unnamed protein product [Owenia fusiformis]|uniref:EamA domain-containing protein n=1 Tax=Owenia fusiformis TaxID=6347 RepID=A0A8S4NM48_OWEFU|nr:unnamed protein product [Owenia fusiformis]
MIPHLFIASIWLIKTQGQNANALRIQDTCRPNIFSLINSALYTSAVVMLVAGLRTMAGMGSIFSIMSSGRLVLVVILSRIFLKESLNLIKICAVVTSIAGIISVTQPNLIFKYMQSSILLQPFWTLNSSSITEDQTTYGTTNLIIGTHIVPESIPPIWQGYIIAFIDLINVSAMAISTSILIKKTTSSPEMFFSMSAVGISFTAVGTCFEGFKRPNNLHDVLCIIGFTVGSIGYNIGYIITMKLLPASIATIIFTFNIVQGILLQ